MRVLFVILMMFALVVTAQDDGNQKIIPVSVWPRVINLADKQIVNPSMQTCVKVGYRLLGAEPATPPGKRVKTREVIQDPDKPEMAKIVCTYEDIPEPPAPPPPEVLTNVASDKVTFRFTADGSYRGATWIDAPVTNGVK